jgi:Tfp pilus assembly protein PilO
MTIIRRVAAEKRAFVLPLAVALVGNVLFYALAVYPLSRTVAGAEERSRAAALDLQNAAQSHAAAQATLTGKSRADEELRKFYRDVLPAGYGRARETLYPRLIQFAQRAGLRPGRSALEPPKAVDDSPLGQIQMTFIVVGDYSGIREFIHELETAPEFVIIERVALAQSETREAGLQLTLDVTTYYQAATDGN